MKLQHLTSDRLHLRRCEREDASLIYTLENDPSLAHSNTLIEPLARFQARQIVSAGKSELLANGFLLLVAERFANDSTAPNECIGVVQLYNFDIFNRRAALGIVLKQPFQGLGYGSQLIQMLLGYAFDTLSLHQLYAEIYPSNKPAMACFKKQGFRLVATLPDWYKIEDHYEDLNILSITCSTYKANR